jgi:hypothetical protein
LKKGYVPRPVKIKVVPQQNTLFPYKIKIEYLSGTPKSKNIKSKKIARIF